MARAQLQPRPTWGQPGPQIDQGVARARWLGADLDAATPPRDTTTPGNGPFPAFTVSMPQAVSLGGPVMAAPRITAITFSNDVHASQAGANAPSIENIEGFVSFLGASPEFWGALDEYGVGAGSSTEAIRLAEAAPSVIADDAVSFDPQSNQLVPSVRSWLIEKLDGTHPEFATPDENSLYALFFPVSTTITLGPGLVSCSGFGGYHDNITLPASDRFPKGLNVAYAVLPRCADQDTPNGSLEGLTVAASHEFAEAATDPFPEAAPAFFTTDDAHLAFSVFGGEIGDLCEVQEPVSMTLPNSPVVVQRLWSNKAAAAGEDPCIPNVEHLAWFDSVPNTPDQLEVRPGTTIPGVKVPAGTTKTVEIDLFSDRDTDAWTVKPVVAQGNKVGLCMTTAAPTGPIAAADCADRQSGRNGDKLFLTVSADANTQAGFALVPIVSALGKQRHLWWLVVQN
jgi:hypothetical protein